MATDVATPELDRAAAPAPIQRSRQIFDVWIPLGVLATFPFVLLVGGGQRISDPDTFWHIRAGHYLLDTGAFSGPEPWSSFSTHEWVLHEWLVEVAMAAADSIGGLAGVAWLWYAGMVAVFVAIFLACRHQGSLLQALIGAVGGWFGASSSLAPRPQLVTFALLAVTVGAWLLSSRDLRARWWLIPMTWVWACAHGMWFTGPLVGFAVTLGLLADGRDRRSTLRLGLLSLLSLAAGAVTPIGPKLLLAPFSVGDYTKYVTEWSPSALTSPTYAVTLGLLVLTLLLWSRRKERVTWTQLALWLMALGWTLLYARTVALGAVIAAPLLVGALNTALAGSVVDRPNRRGEILVLLGSVTAVLATAALILPGSSSLPDKVPSGLDAQLDALPARTVIFNEYSLGGWLLWRHATLSPVIDGRTEVFTVAYVEKYMTTRRAAPGWQKAIDGSTVSAALVTDDSPLGDALVSQRHWAVVGSDGGYLLLKAP